MSARSRLEVVLRVEVRINEDDRIGGGQGQTESARFRAEQKRESVGRFLVEALDGCKSLFASHGSVQAFVSETCKQYRIFNLSFSATKSKLPRKLR